MPNIVFDIHNIYDIYLAEGTEQQSHSKMVSFGAAHAVNDHR